MKSEADAKASAPRLFMAANVAPHPNLPQSGEGAVRPPQLGEGKGGE